MQDFITRIKSRARINPKHIVFPEGSEERILRATAQIQTDKTAHITLIGDADLIKNKAKDLDIQIDFTKCKIHNPETSPNRERYAKALIDISKAPITPEEALEKMKDINYFGTMMVHLQDVDAMVSGCASTTADTIRPALQIIKPKQKFHKVSGLYLMVLQDRLLFFADTAIIIEPTAQELAHIASDTIQTAKRFGIEPKVAMLSFSTNNSAQDQSVEKIQEATKLAKELCPNTIIEGEIQVDAAIVPEVSKIKSPNSQLKGEANILIFPDLNSGNIAYKLVEQLAKAQAIGPIIQGLNKPINDLSRGCSFQDIVDITAITVCEAQTGFHYHQVLDPLSKLKP